MTTWQELLYQQDGVLSRRQALVSGMTRQQWNWKLERGLWQRSVPGIAVSHSGGTTERQHAWSAVLHAGEGALLSGDAALSLIGLGLHPLTELDVAIPWRRRVAGAVLECGSAPAIVVHRVQGLPRWGRTMRGLPMTTPHAAVLHAAAWAESDRDAEWRVAAAVQRKLTAVPLLRAALVEMPVLKRRALITTVLDDVALGAHAGSELQFLRFCRRHGLPRPDELQVRVRVGAVHYLDARYRRQRLTVEVDGAHHRAVATWEADALRTLRIVAQMPGERVVRLTTCMLRHDGTEVARLLRTILGR